MERLIVGGIDFSGEIPGHWTVEQLVGVLESNVLAGDEVVVGLRIDGQEQPMTALTVSRLDDVACIDIEIGRAAQVVESALASADQAKRRLHDHLLAAVNAFHVGREREGWQAHQRGLETLLTFVDLTERLAGVLAAGLGPGPATADKLQALARELMPRLVTEERATEDGDVLALCDAIEELDAWLERAWRVIWSTPGQASARAGRGAEG